MFRTSSTHTYYKIDILFLVGHLCLIDNVPDPTNNVCPYHRHDLPALGLPVQELMS